MREGCLHMLPMANGLWPPAACDSCPRAPRHTATGYGLRAMGYGTGPPSLCRRSVHQRAVARGGVCTHHARPHTRTPAHPHTFLHARTQCDGQLHFHAIVVSQTLGSKAAATIKFFLDGALRLEQVRSERHSSSALRSQLNRSKSFAISDRPSALGHRP